MYSLNQIYAVNLYKFMDYISCYDMLEYTIFR